VVGSPTAAGVCAGALAYLVWQRRIFETFAATAGK